MSPANTLSTQDVREWVLQTIVFSVAIPVLLVFLQAVQNGIDFKAAALLAGSALLSALVNLLVKYKSGVVATN